MAKRLSSGSVFPTLFRLENQLIQYQRIQQKNLKYPRGKRKKFLEFRYFFPQILKFSILKFCAGSRHWKKKNPLSLPFHFVLVDRRFPKLVSCKTKGHRLPLVPIYYLTSHQFGLNSPQSPIGKMSTRNPPSNKYFSFGETIFQSREEKISYLTAGSFPVMTN